MYTQFLFKLIFILFCKIDFILQFHLHAELLFLFFRFTALILKVWLSWHYWMKSTNYEVSQSEFYVIHTVHALTINTSSNICTLWYIIYDIPTATRFGPDKPASGLLYRCYNECLRNVPRSGVSQGAHFGWYSNTSTWFFHRGPFTLTLAQGFKKWVT